MAKFKKTFKRKTTKKGTGIAKKALNKVNRLARQLKPEVKFIDFKTSAEDFGSVGQVYDLTKGVGLGVNNVTREGRKIRLIRLTGTVQMELVPAKNSGAFRFILARGNMSNGNNFLVSKTAASPPNIPILDDTDQWPLISRKVDNEGKNTRFIYDKTYTLDTGMRRLITQKINFKLGWESQYIAFPGDTAVLQDGNLLVCGMMNAAEENTVVYNLRLWYTDV